MNTMKIISCPISAIAASNTFSKFLGLLVDGTLVLLPLWLFVVFKGCIEVAKNTEVSDEKYEVVSVDQRAQAHGSTAPTFMW